MKTRKYIATLGDFRCTVEVHDATAIVTPPAGVVLQAGNYQLLSAEGDTDQQVGTFTVAADGVIGLAEPTVPPVVARIIRLILQINRLEPKPAEDLDSTLGKLEARAKALAGKLVCKHCGQEHGCDHFGRDESEVRQELELGIKEMIKAGILVILKDLLDATAAVHAIYGFADKADIERQIARVEALLALQPQPAATVATPPDAAEAAEDSPPA